MDSSTLEFTSSLDVDSRLAFYDVMGSIAHARMLGSCKILPAEDVEAIVKGLKKILSQIEDGSFVVDPSLEDIHTNIEFRLTEDIGPVGGKLHTGRSRNDQVATDFKMYLRDVIISIIKAIEDLCNSLITIAENNFYTVLPGFTHLQHAQPVTLAQHALAYVFKFTRDAERFKDAYSRLNYCPLGAAALAGTTYPIERHETSVSLSFDFPVENSMDAVSDRDFVSELAFCAAQTSIHLSSMSEELVYWSSQEFGFIEMDDKYTTGSSIMPQKKNPDIAELIRGKTGISVGALMNTLTMQKGLPLTYNRDLQEDKEPLMNSLSTVLKSLKIMSPLISTMKINADVMRSAAESGFVNATDLADYLVTKGVPFREAHAIVGAAVRKCISEKRTLDNLTIKEFTKFSDLIDNDVYDFINIDACVERRNSQGGTSAESAELQIDYADDRWLELKEFIEHESKCIEDTWNALLQ